jgi:hypothetical protein
LNQINLGRLLSPTIQHLYLALFNMKLRRPLPVYTFTVWLVGQLRQAQQLGASRRVAATEAAA